MRTLLIAVLMTALVAGAWLATRYTHGVDGPARGSDPEAKSTADTRDRNPYREPEFRSAVVDYLVRSGLSKADSERAADAAIEDVTECMAPVGRDSARAAVLEACQATMWQQIGINEAADRRAIMVTVGRELSRRHALEAAAAASTR